MLNLLYAHVSRGTRATLLASKDKLQALTSAYSNISIYIGVVLICIAPFVENLYLYFEERGTDLYYWNNNYWNTFYYLHAIGPDLYAIVLVSGFLIIPKRIIVYASIIPITYKLAHILWLATIDNNADFHKAAPAACLIVCLSIAIVWITCFKWLASLHFHKKEGTVARIIGILTAPNINKELAYDIAHREALKKLELDKI
jgi:hypothetical protein